MSQSSTILNLRDYEVPDALENQLKELLKQSFPDFFDGTTTCCKQRLHIRLLAMENETLLGQLALDIRHINVGGTLLKIAGINNLCVFPEHQSKGVGSQLLAEAEKIALKSTQDFMVLATDEHPYYESKGYQRVQPANLKWLAIENQSSIKLLEEDLSDCFMVKQMGETPWPKGQIDMLGYLF